MNLEKIVQIISEEFETRKQLNFRSQNVEKSHGEAFVAGVLGRKPSEKFHGHLIKAANRHFKKHHSDTTVPEAKSHGNKFRDAFKKKVDWYEARPNQSRMNAPGPDDRLDMLHHAADSGCLEIHKLHPSLHKVAVKIKAQRHRTLNNYEHQFD